MDAERAPRTSAAAIVRNLQHVVHASVLVSAASAARFGPLAASL